MNAIDHPVAVLRDGYWYGCERPEQPYTEGESAYFGPCRGCWLAAKASVVNGFGDVVRPTWDDFGDEGPRVTLATFVAKFAHLHEPSAECAS